MTNVWYATRDDVKRSLEYGSVSTTDFAVDAAIEASSRYVEDITNRVFYPTIATRYFDYPNADRGYSWRVDLKGSEIISLTSALAGTTTLSTANIFLEPANYGPPYTYLEVNRGTSTTWTSATTSQRAIALTGLFGYQNTTKALGTLTNSATSGATTIAVSSSVECGVGALLLIESERCIVTGVAQLSTGATLSGNLTAASNVVTIPVSSGTAFNVGEVITIDTERMLVVDVISNNLTVKRNYDGTQLAAHTSGATVFAPRTLTVERGSLGTTAAAHNSAVAFSRQTFPGLLVSLTIAESINFLLQQTGGYGSTVGVGDSSRSASGGGLGDLRSRVVDSLGRRSRMGVV